MAYTTLYEVPPTYTTTYTTITANPQQQPPPSYQAHLSSSKPSSTTTTKSVSSSSSVSSWYQRMKLENEIRRANEIRYVTPAEAEQITGYGSSSSMWCPKSRGQQKNIYAGSMRSREELRVRYDLA
ncbi:hypothetical protein BU24DRAFT_162077 [Aaosphaeria arxii CBS 175.79]|uniref:Uncharacterized protein n=1 Tax=Aaosphaeria arxii CBS 175.79 TaxID=1450172 RepID=A0A6A5XX63_9PLEO|nr:uncharacterized protein BU24DRAFT_162077 [Aaosphaeria arxii CBS 175.79]KAF2017918.1 hypothetical protein BU24DRAFT_162077 [Aaosphaeria arxii CBS 175.79]